MADVLIPKLYAEYGRYINQFRAFPSILDGAKIVERRILYSLYDVAKDQNQKSAKVVGYCVGNFHPHGDVAAYLALVGMVQNGLATGQGNWGSSVGIEETPAAAQRYTEVRSSKNILDMAFEYIKYVPFQALELDEEPVFLPTKFPICLISQPYYTQGMGFGYRTIIPCYKKEDLIKRLKWVLDGKQGQGPIIKPISDCDFLSPDSEFEKLLTTGDAKIEFKGKFHYEHGTEVVVTSLPQNKLFRSILSKFEKEIEIEKSLGWQDESDKETKVRFRVLKPRTLKLTDFTDKLKEQLTSSISFECNMCNTQGKVVKISIDNMLLNVYNVYKQVVEAVLKDNIAKINFDISQLELIKRMKPLLSVELKQNPDDIEKVVKNISDVLQVKQEHIKEICDKYTISRIFRISTDTVKLNQELNENQKNLNNISDYIWNEKYIK